MYYFYVKIKKLKSFAVQQYPHIPFISPKKSIFLITVFSVLLCGAFFAEAEPITPVILSITPSAVYVGNPGIVLTVDGDNFGVGGESTVYFNGNAKTTYFQSTQQVTADIPASDLSVVGTYDVYVSNAANPNESPASVSNHVTFRVLNSPPPPPPPLPPNCNTGVSCAGSCSAQANTCYSGNGSQNSCVYTAHSTGNSCTQVSAPNQPCTLNNCSGGFVCSGGACVLPSCNTNPSCSGACSAPTNTCSSGNGSQSNCMYTGYTGGGSCLNTTAPNQPCTTNNCSSGLICSSGACIPPPGQITIAKYAVGGSGTFNFTGNIGITSLTVSSPSTTFSQTVSVPPGSNYNISEIVPAGWTQTSATCDNGTPSAITVVSNQNTTCLFTNTKSGSLTIVKNTTGGNDTFSFTVSGNGYGPATHTFTTVGGTSTYTVDNIQPGSGYTIAETDNPIWNLTNSSCTKSNGTSAGPISGFTIETGSTTTCTFNNTIKPGQITIVKNTVGGSGTFTFTGNVGVTSLTVPSGSTTTSQQVDNLPSYNTYTISEDSIAGWTQTSATCTNGTPSAIVVTPNQTTTCTFTNTKKGHIIVVKDASPNDTQDFSFTNNFANGNPSSFSLDDDSDVTLPNSRDFEVLPGTYNLSESIPTAWFQTSATCSDSSPINAIAVAAGETVICIFKNAQAGFIRVTKNTTGGDGTFPLTISGNGLGPVTSSVTTNSGSGDYYSSYMPPGTYTITETLPTGWMQNSTTCGSVTVTSNGTAPCSMSNTKKPRIEFRKTLVPSTDGGRFNLQIDGATAGTGANVGDGGTTGGIYTTIGTHTLSETTGTSTNGTPTDIHNYTIPSFGGDCTGTGTSTTITLNAGDDKICTITNTRGFDTAYLTLNLVVVPSTDTGKFNVQQDYINMANNVGNGWTSGAQWNYVGNKTIGQTAGTSTNLSDYTTTFSGDCNQSGSVAYVNINLGDNKTCTITNTRKGGVTITKNTTGGEGNFDFVLSTISGPPIGPIYFNINTTSGNRTSTITLPTGSYQIDETPPAGWTRTYSTCGNGTFFNVTSGNITSCHVDNNKPITTTLTVKKSLAPSNDPGKFDLKINGTTYADDVGDNGSATISVSAGTYTVSEGAGAGTNLADYTAGIGGDCAGSGTVTIAQGENKTCIITNVKNGTGANGFLKIVKNTTTADGGTFGFTIDGGGSGSASLTVNSGATTANTTLTLIAGNHTVWENSHPDWVQTNATCTKQDGTDAGSALNGFSILAAQVTTCTFTNARKGRLDINKSVVGGTGNFSFTVTGPGYGPLTVSIPGNSGYGISNIPVGTYSAVETVPTGWTKTSDTCGSVDVTAGSSTPCYVTNTRNNNSSITIVKNTVGGSGTFNFTGNAGVTSITVPSGVTTASQTVDKPPGTYNITETVPSGWTQTSATCTNGTPSAITVVANQTTTCTFTNTKLPILTINKTISPSSDMGKFNLRIDGITAGTGINVSHGGTTGAVTSTVGTHTVSETAGTGTNLSNYTTTFSGDCNASGNITLAAGDNKTCTITNTKVGSLTISKTAVGDNGTFSFTISGNSYGPLSQSITTSSGSGSYTANNIPSGTYTATETVPNGWTKTSDTCGSVTVGTGGSASCSVTNTKKGHIIVVKDAVPNDAQDFSFSNNFGNGNPASFSLDDDTNGTLSNSKDSEVAPGTYSLSESSVSGWTQTSATCSDNSPVTAINVSAGETVTCTFTNTKNNGSITLIINSDSNIPVCWEGDVPDVNGPASPGIVCLDKNPDPSLPESYTWNNLIPGTYYFFEQISGSSQVITGVACAEVACDEVLYGSNGSYTHSTWQPGDTGFKVRAQQ